MTDTPDNATPAPVDETVKDTTEETTTPSPVDEAVKETTTPAPVPVDKSLNLTTEETKLLAGTVKKYSAYKNRTKSQELLLTLNAITNKTKADITNIRKILAVEQALITKKATQQKVTAIFRAENLAERKLAEHKKYKIGGAIEALRDSKQSMKVLGDIYPNISFHQFVINLIQSGYLVDEVPQKDSSGNDITIDTGKVDKNNKPILTKVKYKIAPVDKATGLELFPFTPIDTPAPIAPQVVEPEPQPAQEPQEATNARQNWRTSKSQSSSDIDEENFVG